MVVEVKCFLEEDAMLNLKNVAAVGRIFKDWHRNESICIARFRKRIDCRVGYFNIQIWDVGGTEGRFEK